MSKHTPTTEEVRDYIRAADRVTAHMFAAGADSVEAFDHWLAKVQAEAFSEGVNFIDDQPGPWGAGMVAGRAEAARRRAEAEGIVDL
ncbi:hypothetical protein CQ047_12025 [Microbacterium sp. MYb72]|uniref:hypothetical protein n=1 Tax=Microbacterium sp. MYb72 TaxID=1848693 RepID=UPI000CFB743A|nr:hypothetical protein [Microbacterium sp. MYb72]PRB08601.1 hypothetical protein CQ047_12025 [Microbacterium sp. MYb72]